MKLLALDFGRTQYTLPADFVAISPDDWQGTCCKPVNYLLGTQSSN
jgi:hypothetical protein